MGWLLAAASDWKGAVRVLADYDGRPRSYLRAAGSVALLLAIGAMPLAVLIAGAYLVSGPTAQVGVGLALILATLAAGSIWRREVWRRPVYRRLQQWATSDPRVPEVGVLVASADEPVAYRAIARVQLHPRFSRRNPPSPATPGFDVYIGVTQPVTRPTVDYDVAVDRMCRALAAVGVRARVGGRDVPLPSRPATTFPAGAAA